MHIHGRLILAGLLVLTCGDTLVQALPNHQPTEVLKMSREGCFGMCPVFSVTIYDDGTYLYEGKEFVRTKGKRRGKVSHDSIRRMVKTLVDSGFLTASRDCNRGSDLPGTTMILTRNGQRKTVTDRGCGNESIADIANEISRFKQVSEWVGPPPFHEHPIWFEQEAPEPPLLSIPGAQPDPNVLRKLLEHLGPPPRRIDF